MTERERLVELISDAGCPIREQRCLGCKYLESEDCLVEVIADQLLANGVIVLPCRVGDTVWFIKSLFGYAKQPMCGKVYAIKTYTSENIFTFCVTMDNSRATRTFTSADIGKTAFLTKEEAEKALEKENVE